MACCACTVGVLIHLAHRYAQFGCGALVARSQVSAQPVAPSCGIVSATGALASLRSVVMIGQPAPSVTSPLLKAVSKWAMSGQYSLTSGRCCLRRLTAASNCGCVSSYGSVILRSGLVLLR